MAMRLRKHVPTSIGSCIYFYYDFLFSTLLSIVWMFCKVFLCENFVDIGDVFLSLLLRCFGCATYVSVMCACVFSLVLFSADDVVRYLRGCDVTLPRLQKNGFEHPIIVKEKKGLGLFVPPPDFAVTDVARHVGKTMHAQLVLRGYATLKHRREMHDSTCGVGRHVHAFAFPRRALPLRLVYV